jgi:hypothetical protein
MSNSAGFEVLLELSRDFLQNVIDEERKGDTVLPKTIPLDIDLGLGSAFDRLVGAANTEAGAVTLDLVPDRNAVALTLSPVAIQLEVEDPPAPCAALLEMSIAVSATVPLSPLEAADGVSVAAILGDMQRSDVVVDLISGHPLADDAFMIDVLECSLHAAYSSGAVAIDGESTITLPGLSARMSYLLLNDLGGDPDRRIVVSPISEPGEDLVVAVTFPVHVKLFDIESDLVDLASPMDFDTTILVASPLERRLTVGPGLVRFPLVSEGAVFVGEIIPGENYAANAAAIAPLSLDSLMRDAIRSRAAAILEGLGDYEIPVPTEDQLAERIGDVLHDELTAAGASIPFWTPGGIDVTQIVPRVLPEALAIGINPLPGADAGDIVHFLTEIDDFGVAFDEEAILTIAEDRAGELLPHTTGIGRGRSVRLNDVDVALGEGFVAVSGDATLIRPRAIPIMRNINASFEGGRVSLAWQDEEDGSQTLTGEMVEEPDVQLHLTVGQKVVAALLIGLLGLLLLGIVGAIAGVVVGVLIETILGRLARSLAGAVFGGEDFDVLPAELLGIGPVSVRFRNPIEITPDGITIFGRAEVTSKHAGAVDVHARAGGPYLAQAGAERQFVGEPLAPQTDYVWRFGDGSTTEALAPTHVYAASGYYVARFTTNNQQLGVPGGIATWRYAPVRVENVPPRVDAGPDRTAGEGEIIEIVADFADVEWPDRHVAIFDFGDDSPLERGVVAGLHEPPLGRGTARARHAYCDNGEYTVTVRVIDQDGGVGVDTLQVRVRNVAPSVDAGEDRFAYPCAPLTLVAGFTDPGWCDTHAGSWDFGDCTPPRTAVIQERNEPPEGAGIAVATHVYARCGTYRAECTVVDDDGAEGRAAIVVRVVDVRNGDFEGGFRELRHGAVANEWEPYVSDVPTAAPIEPLFQCESCVVHGGRRSQRIGLVGGFVAGVTQRLGTNPGWDYQVSAWFHLEERGAGRYRLGIDPTGGTDPASETVAWWEGNEQLRWAQLAGRVTARGSALTIFLEADVERGAVYLDDVTVIPVPCALRLENGTRLSR